MSDTPNNTGSGLTPWLAAIGLIALQTLVLGWMVWDNESHLTSGREVLLDVEPVDPRALFRGDYVILNYTGLSNLEVPDAKGTGSDATATTHQLRKGGSYGVILAPPAAPGESWAKVRTVADCADRTDDQQACLMGTIKWVGTQRGTGTARVRYGIENYFVPEGAGRKLEDAIQVQKLQVIVALDANGHGLIKGLVVDGQRIADEGLF